MKAININPTDTISGEFYLKLLNDFKKYDQQQKKYISDLRNEIEILNWENERLLSQLKEYEEGASEGAYTRLNNQRKQLHELQLKILELKHKNEELLLKIISLKEK